MIRIFTTLLTLTLLAPFASAGVGASADALAKPAAECWENEGHRSDGYRDEDNSSYSYAWSYQQYQSSRCDERRDDASAEVHSNDQEVASVRAGEYADRSGWSSLRHGSFGYGHSGNESSHGYASESRSSSATYKYAEGREVVASTFAGDARYDERCAGERSSDGGSSSWSSWRSSANGSSSSSGASEWRYQTSRDGCEQAASAQTGITSARAGHESACTSTWSTWAYEGTNGSWNGRECSDEHFAQIGSERVGAGTNESCAYDECVRHTGVRGPNGLGIHRRDAGGASVLVIRHDLAGTVLVPLP